MVQQQFYLGVAAIVGGVAVALFPSNYEIVGMEAIQGGNESAETDENSSVSDES